MNRQDVENTINQNIKDNTTRYISPKKVRDSLGKMLDYIENVANVAFNSDIQVIGTSLGKYNPGETIPSNGKTVQWVLKDIAYEAIAPVAHGSIASATREAGSSKSYTLTWSVDKKTNTITSITVAGSSVTPTGNNQSGSKSLTAPTNAPGDSFTKSVVVSDGTLSDTANVTLKYVYGIFYGDIASTPTTSADVRGLTNRLQTQSHTFTLNTGITNKNFVVAIPDTMSLVSVVDKDALNLDVTSSYVKSGTLTQVNDAGGTPRNYDVYVMSQAVPYGSSHRHEIKIS